MVKKATSGSKTIWNFTRNIGWISDMEVPLTGYLSFSCLAGQSVYIISEKVREILLNSPCCQGMLSQEKPTYRAIAKIHQGV